MPTDLLDSVEETNLILAPEQGIELVSRKNLFEDTQYRVVLEGHSISVMLDIVGVDPILAKYVQIFIDDPNFRVTVVSTYNYNFENANNVLIDSTQEEKSKINTKLVKKFFNALRMIIALINIQIKIFPEIILGFRK